MADDYLLDEGDEDEPIIEEEIEYNYDGAETIITRSFSPSAGVTEKTRSYTEMSGGSLIFGYRDVGSRNRNPRYSVVANSYSNYLGIACNASTIKIMQDESRASILLITKIGSSYYGLTGYLSVITKINKSQQDGFDWTIEKLPFQNGICVAYRGT